LAKTKIKKELLPKPGFFLPSNSIILGMISMEKYTRILEVENITESGGLRHQLEF